MRPDAGDPADRARRDNRLERIVRQAMIILLGRVEHEMRSLTAKAGYDFTQWRTRTIFRLLVHPPDMHKAGDLLSCAEAERVEHAAIIGVPLGNPARRIAERVRGGDE